MTRTCRWFRHLITRQVPRRVGWRRRGRSRRWGLSGRGIPVNTGINRGGVEVDGGGRGRSGASTARMLCRPRVLTAVLPRHSNRTVIVVDARPPILDLVTSKTTPLAIDWSPRLPKRRAHMNAERMCLTLACTRDPTSNRASPIVGHGRHTRGLARRGVPGGGKEREGTGKEMECGVLEAGDARGEMSFPRVRHTACDTPASGQRNGKGWGGARVGGRGVERSHCKKKRACHGCGGL